MGAHIRQALIVTGEFTHFEKAYLKAKELFCTKIDGIDMCLVSDIVGSFNGYKNFSVFDSGSKVGWELDDEFKDRMKKMIEYLNSTDCKYKDGSSCNDWVLVEYGDDGRRIKKSNCKNKFQ